MKIFALVLSACLAAFAASAARSDAQSASAVSPSPSPAVVTNVVASGYAFGSRADVSNALYTFTRTSGTFRYGASLGAYAFPVVGQPLASAFGSNANTSLYGLVPIGYLEYAPTGHFAVMAGKLAALLGQEGVFTYQNVDIRRGLGWNMEPLISRGVRVAYATGKWYGFNAGSELRVDAVTASAFLNTDIAASFAAVAWLLIEWAYGRQPKFVGLLTGAVAGLATITPAAGYVSPVTAIVFGILAGVVCYYAVALKNRLKWDDALDVWGVHGVGGFTGIVLLGVFASKAWNPNGADGLLLGGTAFFIKQCVAVTLCSVWAFAFTYGMLWLISRITLTKVDRQMEERGLDIELHGEEAYPLGI